MKSLRELVKIVTRRRISKVEMLDEDILNDPTSLYNQFYTQLSQEEFMTDDEAAAYFYGSDSTNDAYRKLKSRFKKRIFNNLFYLDINDPYYSDYFRAFYTVNKNYALCRILAGQSAITSFVKLAKRTLNIAVKFEIYDIAILLVKELKKASVLFNKLNDYKKYDEQLQEYNKIIMAESEMESIYQRLAFHYNRVLTLSDQELAELEQNAIQIGNSVNSYTTQSYLFRSLHIISNSLHDYSTQQKNATRAINYFQNHDTIANERIVSVFLVNRMEAHLSQKNLDSAQKDVLNAIEITSENSSNWFIFYEYYFLISMHQEQYNQSLDIYLRITNHPQYEYLSPIKKEKWRILEAYLLLALMYAGKSNEEIKDMGLRTFKIHRFMNDVPSFEKDKAGYNASILILQAMWYMMQDKSDKVIERAEALQNYRYKYLQNIGAYRTQLFIKMLTRSEKRSFDYKATIKATDKMFQELKEDRRYPVTEWEIIPYERLWEMFLQIIK